MKYFLIIFLFPYIGLSQINFHFNYTTTASGKNFSTTISKMNEKENEFGIGLKYNINSLKHPDDQFNVFYKRLYSTKPIHHFGFEAFYHKRIIKEWKAIKPFVFYNFQISNSTTRNRSFLPVGQDTNGEVLYKEYIAFFGPYLWIEQSLGLGYNVKLTEKFHLTSKLGFEVLLLNGKDERRLFSEKFIREFGYLFNFGIAYRLKKQTKKHHKIDL